jgi:DNA topoisomerase-1
VVSYIDKKIKIPNAEEKDRHLQRLNNREYYLKERSVKKVKRVPKPPFTTSTLQQEAGKRLHLPSAKTMRIAQSLYEGVEIGEKGPIGLITYMRTDSVRTAPEAIAKARSYIADAYGLKYLPDKPRLHTTKGRAQEAHEAIRPADTALEPKKIKKYLSKEQFELYQLIFTRFIASQMNDAVFEQTTLTISAEEYLLRATETVTVFRGFLQVWSEAEEENGDKESIASKLPKKYAVGDKLDLRQLLPEQHFTEPPLRYTESTLVKALDEKGIGRPSTYASIISVLFDRNYVERKERVLFPTELGETVNTILVNNFPDIFSEGFTANMEDQLDNIESGNLVWDKVVADFYHPFNSTLQDIQTRKTEIRKSLQESAGIKCEKCGSDMVIRWGKRGKFIACSNFPKCRNTKPLNGETQEKKPTVKSDKKCPECGADLFIRQGRYGPFLGCSNYPKCKYIENIELDVKCPRADCKGNIVKKRTKKGKFFFGCDKYPECDFVAWYQPVNKACPSCDNNYMEVHLSKSGEIWKCPKCKNEAKPF